MDSALLFAGKSWAVVMQMLYLRTLKVALYYIVKTYFCYAEM